MRVNITAHRFKLTDDLRNFTEENVSHLNKYYEGIVDVDVMLSWEKFYRLAEIKVSVHGTMLSAKERSEDMMKSIKLSVDKLERQLLKYKDRQRDFNHEKMVGEPVSYEEVEDDYDYMEEE